MNLSLTVKSEAPELVLAALERHLHDSHVQRGVACVVSCSLSRAPVLKTRRPQLIGFLSVGVVSLLCWKRQTKLVDEARRIGHVRHMRCCYCTRNGFTSELRHSSQQLWVLLLGIGDRQRVYVVSLALNVVSFWCFKPRSWFAL